MRTKSAMSIAMRCDAASSVDRTRRPARTTCTRWWRVMTDTSAILASLDRFIEKFSTDLKLRNGQRVATQNGSMATTNQLTYSDIGHSGHFGHPKQETFDGADHARCDPPPFPAEDSGAGLARKVSSVDGYSGQSGQSFSNQALASSHRRNADGHNGQSVSDQQVDSSEELRSSADKFQSDPLWWRDQYQERSRHRELGGRRSRAEAEILAWGELQWRWHKQEGGRPPAGICGGCRTPIRGTEAIPLIDGAYVHDGKGHECLIAYGSRWRREASAGLRALGLEPPSGFDRQ